jgi:hypothetical protein
MFRPDGAIFMYVGVYTMQEAKGDCINPNIPEDGPIRPKHVVGKKRVV